MSIEIEEIGWDSPGFRDSEFTISISQFIDFFGQGAARKNVAQTEINATELQLKRELFDLYLNSKLRFYQLAHAQQSVIISQTSYKLANEIVENIKYRLDKGASLQSEILLAQLEQQLSQLTLDQANQDEIAYKITLASLWGKDLTNYSVLSNTEPDFSVLQTQVDKLSNLIDSSREISQLLAKTRQLKATRKLTVAEAKPPITISGGFKKFESDNSKSFLLGVSMPIPFFNRNQGTNESLNLKIHSLQYQIKQSKNETRAKIKSQSIRLIQLVEKHTVLDSLLLPTAKKVYQTLETAYKVGRVPYTQLLEAERTLNELRFSHNDILLAIQEQIIALEYLTGVTLRNDKEFLIMSQRYFIIYITVLFSFCSISLFAQDDHDHDHDNEKEIIKLDNENDVHVDEEALKVVLTSDAVKLAGITIKQVDKGSIARTIELPGEIGFNEDMLVHVSPRFAGIALKAKFRVGDYVKEGEVVAVVESNESLNSYSIKAPISGWVIERHITTGEYVSEENSIFIIADLSTVWVNLAVYPRDVNHIKINQTASIEVIGRDNVITGTIEYIAPIMDPKTRSLTARVTLRNENKNWHPGSFVQATISTDAGIESIVVEKNAVQILDEKSVIFIAIGHNTFVPLEIITGDSNQTHIQILSELQIGTKYVTNGSFELKAKIVTSNLDAHAGHGH